MINDKVLGAGLLAAGVIVLIVYIWALFFAGPTAWWIAISIVALIAVGALCVIIAWIGYTLVTTPAPTLPTTETTETTATEEVKPQETQ